MRTEIGDLAAENLAQALPFNGFGVRLETGFAVEGHRSPAKPCDCRTEQVLYGEKLLNAEADDAPDERTENPFDRAVKRALLGWLFEPAGVMSGDAKDPDRGAEHDKDEWKVER